MPSNKLLPVACAVILILVGFVAFKSDNNDHSASMQEVPIADNPDVDSPADTLRTLTAEVANTRAESKSLAKQNEKLFREANQLKSEVQQKIDQAIKNNANPADTALASITDKLSQLTRQYDQLSAKTSASQIGNSDALPPGLGIGKNGYQPADLNKITWVEPLNGNQTNSQSKSTSNLTPQGSVLHPTGQKDKSDTNNTINAALDRFTPKQTPVYTVPRNATLIGSTGMTALIGRIPIEGTVQDPFPFKVIVGRDNLAANGIEMPGLDGMIFSGTSSGDWSLSCVRGSVHSVTYVFEDETIRTLSSDDGSLQSIQQTQQNQGAGSGGSQGRQNLALGWISDRRGIPCITGQRISNASEYLSGRVLARAAEAAAKAFGAGETTRQVSPFSGVSTQVITGDAAKFAGLEALSGGASELGDYIKERAAQAFDVVYVDTGAELAVHIDQQLPIDYDPNGRKTDYAFAHSKSAVSASGLD